MPDSTTRTLARLLNEAESFSRSDALGVGLHAHDLSRAVARGELVRLAPGRYGPVVPAENEFERHLRRTRALIGRLRGSAVASHYSALALLGLPVIDADLGEVHLMYRRSRGHHRRQGYVVHPFTESVDPSRDTVSPAVAIVATGLLLGRRSVLVAGDAALHRGLTTRAELSAVVSARARSHRIGVVRAAVAALDERSESPGESLLRDDLTTLGYRVICQPEVICRNQVYRPDFRIEGTRVLVEFDGAVKYVDARDLRAEKRREEDLRAEHWALVRFMWPDLGRLDEIRGRVEAAVWWSSVDRSGPAPGPWSPGTATPIAPDRWRDLVRGRRGASVT